jgi:hypothetical protein
MVVPVSVHESSNQKAIARFKKEQSKGMAKPKVTLPVKDGSSKSKVFRRETLKEVEKGSGVEVDGNLLGQRR